MKMPAYYDDVPTLRLHDPLAELLGSADGGVIEYCYADVVRLCGHSCPTVAAAYWLTWRALRELWPEGLPQRGRVLVEFRNDAREGSTGVVASVVQMLTGASGRGGFKGIAGRHARAGLLRFAPELPLSLRFTSLDSGAAVDADASLALLPPSPELDALLHRCIRGTRDTVAMARLGELWQQRVRHLLLDLADDPEVFVIRRAVRRRAAPPDMAIRGIAAERRA